MAVLLLLCLVPMPYGYYQLVRFIAMIVFGFMAYQYYNQKKVQFTIIFASLALLFQPLIKISLGRALWNIVDVIVAIFLVILFFSRNEKV